MAQITDDYVSFETAKLLKEKGFDENTPVNYFVGDDKPRGCVVGEMIYHKRAEEDTHLIACPTLWMAMKWLREVHKIDISVDPYKVGKDWMYLFHVCQNKDYLFSKYIDASYENCIEAAIKYCLENLI